MRRSLALALVNGTLAVAAATFLLLRFVWVHESWAPYARTASIIVCLLSLALLYRLKDPVLVALRSVVSPNWKRMAVGLLLMVSAVPWSMLIGLAVRYKILPDNLATALLLLIPLAALVVTGAYNLLWGFLARRRPAT